MVESSKWQNNSIQNSEFCKAWIVDEPCWCQAICWCIYYGKDDCRAIWFVELLFCTSPGKLHICHPKNSIINGKMPKSLRKNKDPLPLHFRKEWKKTTKYSSTTSTNKVVVSTACINCQKNKNKNKKTQEQNKTQTNN